MSVGARIAELLDRGLGHYALGEVDRAIACWREVLSLDTGNARAREYLSLVNAPAEPAAPAAPAPTGRVKTRPPTSGRQPTPPPTRSPFEPTDARSRPSAGGPVALPGATPPPGSARTMIYTPGPGGELPPPLPPLPTTPPPSSARTMVFTPGPADALPAIAATPPPGSPRTMIYTPGPGEALPVPPIAATPPPGSSRTMVYTPGPGEALPVPPIAARPPPASSRTMVYTPGPGEALPVPPIAATPPPGSPRTMIYTPGPGEALPVEAASPGPGRTMLFTPTPGQPLAPPVEAPSLGPPSFTPPPPGEAVPLPGSPRTMMFTPPPGEAVPLPGSPRTVVFTQPPGEAVPLPGSPRTMIYTPPPGAGAVRPEEPEPFGLPPPVSEGPSRTMMFTPPVAAARSGTLSFDPEAALRAAGIAPAGELLGPVSVPGPPVAPTEEESPTGWSTLHSPLPGSIRPPPVDLPFEARGASAEQRAFVGAPPPGANVGDGAGPRTMLWNPADPLSAGGLPTPLPARDPRLRTPNGTLILKRDELGLPPSAPPEDLALAAAAAAPLDGTLVGAEAPHVSEPPMLEAWFDDDPVPPPLEASSLPPPRPQPTPVRAPAPAPAPGTVSAWDLDGGGDSIDFNDGAGDALDLVDATPPRPIPRPKTIPPGKGASEADRLVIGARELAELGDFTGSLELVQKALRLDANHAEALDYLRKNESTLVQMYESKLQPLGRVPRVQLKPDEIVWLNLDHRAGFVLAQIDGSVTFDDVFALSGMSRLDTARILIQLLDQAVIAA